MLLAAIAAACCHLLSFASICEELTTDNYGRTSDTAEDQIETGYSGIFYPDTFTMHEYWIASFPTLSVNGAMVRLEVTLRASDGTTVLSPFDFEQT